MDRLKDKIAVVTGGSSGIGEATVRKFVAEGARVVIADMQSGKGEALASELGECTRFIKTDVCFENQVEAAIRLANETWGRLDCLFNNAGFSGVAGPIDQLDVGEPYQRTVAAMLDGPIFGMKHAAPIMKAQGSGSIISTASIAGLQAARGPHVYSAIKAGLINLSRSVALELGPHSIRVNTVIPGFITTPIFLGQNAVEQDHSSTVESVKEHAAKCQPMPRAGLPEDIANTVCFLASDEASFITGQPIVVDGGITLGPWPYTLSTETVQEATGIDLTSVDTVFHADAD